MHKVPSATATGQHTRSLRELNFPKMLYHDQLRARIRTSLVLLSAIMFSPSAIAVPLEPEAHEPYGYQHGQSCNLEHSSSFPPGGGQERIALPVPFLEPEPHQGPLAQEIRVDLIDEFTPTYQQLEGSVYNNYWTETPLNPELSGSGAAYDQSSYHNRGGKGNVFVDPSGQRARTGCVNIHLPGEEVGDLAYPEVFFYISFIYSQMVDTFLGC